MSETLPGIGKIHEAITAIMHEVGAVKKTRTNDQQKYKFRGIADITLACQPVMAKHKVHVAPHSVIHEQVTERKTKSGAEMLHIRQTIEFRFYHADGSFVPCVTTGEAMDTGDKTSNKVMSAALKYALTQTFCIPEDDPEADTESSSPEIGTKTGNGQPDKPAPEGPPIQEGHRDLLLQVGREKGLVKGKDSTELKKFIAKTLGRDITSSQDVIESEFQGLLDKLRLV